MELTEELLNRESDKEWLARIKKEILHSDSNLTSALLREIYTRESDQEWMNRIREKAKKIEYMREKFMY